MTTTCINDSGLQRKKHNYFTVMLRKGNSLPLFLALLCVLTGCTVSGERGEFGDDVPIAVIGVTTRSGLKAPLETSMLASDLTGFLLSEQSSPTRFDGRPNVVRAASVRTVLGTQFHDDMLRYYARFNRLAPYQVQRLMAANLGARYALLVRFEQDTVEELPMVREPVYDASGLLFSDRERHVYVTKRTTGASAQMLDLRNGRVVWQRAFVARPQKSRLIVSYVGENFPDSVVATLANTVVYGMGSNDYPEPPLLNETAQAVLQKIAQRASTQ